MEPEWKYLSRREAYKGYVVLSDHEVKLPNGEVTHYVVDESIPFGVAVLGLTDDGLLRLAREYRYPVGRWIFDLPGGAGEIGEDPPSAARREHEEETGLRPTDLEFLHTFYQDPSRTSYPIHLYFCRSVVPGVQTVDPQEIVHTVEMSVDEFDAKVREGEIIDPPLLIARLVAGLKGLIPLAS